MWRGGDSEWLPHRKPTHLALLPTGPPRLGRAVTPSWAGGPGTHSALSPTLAQGPGMGTFLLCPLRGGSCLFAGSHVGWGGCLPGGPPRPTPCPPADRVPQPIPSAGWAPSGTARTSRLRAPSRLLPWLGSSCRWDPPCAPPPEADTFPP